jgi:hypothetical protein
VFCLIKDFLELPTLFLDYPGKILRFAIFAIAQLDKHDVTFSMILCYGNQVFIMMLT